MSFERVPFRNLLIETKDGEWGQADPFPESVEMVVIRGTDFESVTQGLLVCVPVRHIAGKAAARKTLVPLDILIETAGGSKGKPTGKTTFLRANLFARSSLPLTCASFARFLRIDAAQVEPEFVYWYLQSLYKTGVIETYQVQHTGIARFQFTKFADSIEIPIPSRQDQQTVTNLLGALDDRIALLRETNATLEGIAQALFKSWFVDFDPVRAKMEGRAPAGIDEATAALFPDGFEESELGLGLVPKGWTATTLAALTKQHGGSIQTGPFGSQLHASDYVPDGIPAVMPKDIANRRVATDSVARIDAINVERLARHKLQVGDIVFSRRGDVEKHALIGDREVGWLCGTGCLLVRPGKNWIAPHFLSMALDAPAARLWLVQHAVGATMPNLNTGILGSVRLVLPPSVLLAAFENVIAASKALQSHNASTIETLATLRDTLLPRLISGQLRLPEAAEEMDAMQ